MSTRAQFHRQLVESFSDEDLAVLCNDLGVDPELIPGNEQGKAYWADQIITYFDDRGRLNELLARLRTERPRLQWAYVPGPVDVLPHIGNARRLGIWAAVGMSTLAVIAVGIITVMRPFGKANTPTATSLPTMTVTTNNTAITMPVGRFNIVVADFGQIDANGAVVTSSGASLLSQYMFESLRDELAPVRKDLPGPLKPEIWHDSLGNQIDTKIGLVLGNSADTRRNAARALAERLNVSMVIYGNLQRNGDRASFTPEFYVAPIREEADDLVGQHKLGAPIEVQVIQGNQEQWAQGLRLNQALNTRQQALAFFTLGLIFDFGGDHTSAVSYIERSLKALQSNPDRSGEDIVHFFLGRQHLFLFQLQADHPISEVIAAENAFSQSLQINAAYARGHIGLGGVYLSRVNYLGQTELITAALEQYQQAYEDAQKLLDTQVQNRALVSLGTAYYKRGEIYANEGHDGVAADAAFEQATINIGNALPQIQGQFRLLGQAYLALGNAYSQRAALAKQRGDETGRKQHFDWAVTSYQRCVDQKANTIDETLNTIADSCQRYLTALKAQ